MGSDQTILVVEEDATCRAFLAEQCHLAYKALNSVPRSDNPISTRAIDDMEMLLRFVEAAAS